WRRGLTPARSGSISTWTCERTSRSGGRSSPASASNWARKGSGSSPRRPSSTWRSSHSWTSERRVILTTPYPRGPHGQRSSPMSKKLEGKVAVITGSNSGSGLATARRFVAEGAHVFITGRRQAELDTAVKQIGNHVTGVRGDVSNLADLDRLFATVKQQKGNLDVLFANAGVGALA